MSSSTSTPALPATGGAESTPAQSGQSSTAPLRAIIKHSDMDEETQQDVVDLASEALEKYNIEKDIAMHIKKEADRRFGTTWHCVVGKNFGSFVTHETRYFIYFYLGQIAILLWKSS